MGRGAPGEAQRPIPFHLWSPESGVDRRCEIANTAMRSHRVVIVLPDCQYFAGMGKGREQGLVEAFVPQPTVEALDERRARYNATRCRAPATSAHRHAGELGTVIGNDYRRTAAASVTISSSRA